ncbi:MAG: hypothetical protein JRI36_01520 [Deltaproteobacteria bacterium]|nr:hypothetical protein [Deltaproteobacteria bacterium]
MKDERGLYYHPFPQNKRVRMYVRKDEGTIWFRLWSTDDEKLWEEHGWVPYEAVEQATAMYEGKNFDPGRAYDIEVARMLLKVEG